jgi:hypothetical protein
MCRFSYIIPVCRLRDQEQIIENHVQITEHHLKIMEHHHDVQTTEHHAQVASCTDYRASCAGSRSIMCTLLNNIFSLQCITCSNTVHHVQISITCIKCILAYVTQKKNGLWSQIQKSIVNKGTKVDYCKCRLQ